jgi:hypothetical protein
MVLPGVHSGLHPQPCIQLTDFGVLTIEGGTGAAPTLGGARWMRVHRVPRHIEEGKRSGR